MAAPPSPPIPGTVNVPVQLEPRDGDVFLTPDELSRLSLFQLIRGGNRRPRFGNFPGAARLRHYHSGEQIWRQGEVGHSAFYILTAEDLGKLEAGHPEVRGQWDRPPDGTPAHEEASVHLGVAPSPVKPEPRSGWSRLFGRQSGTAHVSASQDADTHGRKLYSLFARDREAYFHLASRKSAPVGQVLVKQSWVPEEVPAAATAAIPRSEILVTPPREGEDKKGGLYKGDHFWPFAVGKDGKRYKATKLAGLFLMLKLDPRTPGTDAGWLYGTVTPDGKKVTSVGRVESCMKCHQEAKHDRLFGLQP
jgi:hypothetical protein